MTFHRRNQFNAALGARVGGTQAADVGGPDDEEELVLAAYCPACFVREFKDSTAERKESE